MIKLLSHKVTMIKLFSHKVTMIKLLSHKVTMINLLSHKVTMIYYLVRASSQCKSINHNILALYLSFIHNIIINYVILRPLFTIS